MSPTPNSIYTFAFSGQSTQVAFRYTDDAYARGVYYQGPNAGTAFTGNDLQFAEGIALAPEPSTWAMMILGFCIVGGALRRGRPASDRTRRGARVDVSLAG